jgi:probable blue pigment (indigoidine) exporter
VNASSIRARPASVSRTTRLRPRRPREGWWWRSLVLGTLDVALFFPLLYLAAHRLPSSVASTVMASSPLVMVLVAWVLVAERPRTVHLVGGLLGLAGVAALVLGGTAAVDASGLAASAAALLCSSVGFLLGKRWGAGADLLAVTAWQLTAGGTLLVVAALASREPWPALTTAALAGFGYLTLVATALAFVAWSAALRRLSTGTVGLVGLLNPVTGVTLGLLLAGESLSPRQAVGLALVLVGIGLGQPAASRLGAHLGSLRAWRPSGSSWRWTAARSRSATRSGCTSRPAGRPSSTSRTTT